MARKTVVQYFSDLSGKEVDEGATVPFSLDGTSYEIDLTKGEQKKLRELLKPYIEAGRPTPIRRASSASSGHDPKVIRSWAVEQGMDVPKRGRIPASLITQYEAAH